MLSSYCAFTNDNNVKIMLPTHEFSNTFAGRDECEFLFRRINTYLINSGVIKNNIIDLGAWIGDNSIPWAKNISGIVYAIDPSDRNCNFIREVCALNEIKNVNVIQTAISDKVEILHTDDWLDHCSFVYGSPGTHSHFHINATTLDTLYSENMIDNIGYIHLDVEGMERRVLEGASNIIKNFKPIITFEQHLEIDDYKATSEFVRNNGYEVYLINEVMPHCRHDCRNFIAFPTEIITSALIDEIQASVGRILQLQI